MPKARQLKRYSRPAGPIEEEDLFLTTPAMRRVTKSVMTSIERHRRRDPLFENPEVSTMEEIARIAHININIAIETRSSAELFQWFTLGNILRRLINQGQTATKVKQECGLRRDEYHAAIFLSEVFEGKSDALQYMTAPFSDIKLISLEAKRRITKQVRDTEAVLYAELPEELEAMKLRDEEYTPEDYAGIGAMLDCWEGQDAIDAMLRQLELQ